MVLSLCKKILIPSALVLLFIILSGLTHPLFAAGEVVLEKKNSNGGCLKFVGCSIHVRYTCLSSDSHKYHYERQKEFNTDTKEDYDCPIGSVCKPISDGIQCVTEDSFTPLPNTPDNCRDDNTEYQCFTRDLFSTSPSCPAGWLESSLKSCGNRLEDCCFNNTPRVEEDDDGSGGGDDDSTSTQTGNTCEDPRTANGRIWDCRTSCAPGVKGGEGGDYLCPNVGESCCNMGPAGTNPPPATTNPAPTPPTDGPGYCGDSIPTNSTLKTIGSPSCAPNASNLTWRKRNTDSSGYDPYCDSTTGGQQRYFYTCAATPPPTPTPTPFIPAGQGSLCNPVQGPWQCAAPNVCLYVSGSEGRCCPSNTSWIDGTCKVNTPSTPSSGETGSSGGSGTTPPTPTPVATGSTCNDYIPASNIHQVCRQNSCQSGENENTGGNKACSDFYGSTYGKCCQLPQGTGPAGSSCNLPGRPCNPSQNTSTGTNNACSGCGGYCVGSGTSGSCQNPY